ncbi:hypothetical protein IID22_04705 [Patescibacteria group bacterium]|nr:hypothetical protein [Patescibacteria group bacterium]
MEIFGLSIEGTVKPNIRTLAVPVFVVVVLLILAFVIGQTGIRQITSKIKELGESRKVENKLEARATVLERVEGVVLGQADVSIIALPEKNPSLLMLTQLSTQAEKHSLTLLGKKTRAGAPAGKGITSGEISFSLKGDLKEIIEFLKDIKTLAPLSSIDEVSVKLEGGEATVGILLSIYWSSFPTELPPITQPITELKQEEQAILDRISVLQKPEFITLTPSSPSEREDPFN